MALRSTPRWCRHATPLPPLSWRRSCVLLWPTWRAASCSCSSEKRFQSRGERKRRVIAAGTLTSRDTLSAPAWHTGGGRAWGGQRMRTGGGGGGGGGIHGHRAAMHEDAGGRGTRRHQTVQPPLLQHPPPAPAPACCRRQSGGWPARRQRCRRPQECSHTCAHTQHAEQTSVRKKGSNSGAAAHPGANTPASSKRQHNIRRPSRNGTSVQPGVKGRGGTRLCRLR